MRKNRLARVIVTACALALVVAPIADAKPRKVRSERNLSLEYASPRGVNVASLWAYWCLPDPCGDTIAVESGEKYLDVEVVDQTGTATPFEIYFKDTSQFFCGSASDVFLNGAKEIGIDILSVSVPNCPGPGTTGTVSATFSNLP